MPPQMRLLFSFYPRLVSFLFLLKQPGKELCWITFKVNDMEVWSSNNLNSQEKKKKKKTTCNVQM